MARSHNDYVESVFVGNYAKIYGLMVESIESTADNSLLAELYQSVNNSGQSLALPIADNVEIVRMFIRLGVLEEENDFTYNTSIITSVIASLVLEADRSAALVSVIIRLFAAGQYGIIANPVCGSSPQCSKCRLTKYCKFFNSPPPDPQSRKLPPLKRLEIGAENDISDKELFSLIIGGNRPSNIHTQAANNIFSRFGSLRALSNSNLAELQSLRDVGNAAAVRIYAALMLYKRIAKEQNQRKITIKTSDDLYNIFKLELRDQQQEHFYLVMLDSMNGVIAQKQIALGGVSAVQVDPREVFSPALKHSANAVAFIHNHPCGNPAPSRDDILLTHQLQKAGELLGIKVIDHMIIGEDKYVSFLNDRIGPFKKKSRQLYSKEKK